MLQQPYLYYSFYYICSATFANDTSSFNIIDYERIYTLARPYRVFHFGWFG